MFRFGRQWQKADDNGGHDLPDDLSHLAAGNLEHGRDPNVSWTPASKVWNGFFISDREASKRVLGSREELEHTSPFPVNSILLRNAVEPPSKPEIPPGVIDN
jgi:hypothetical protein